MSYKLSEESQKVIKKHIDAGYIIDPYSKYWVQAHERVELINDQCETVISEESFDDLEDEYGSDYQNHLLIVYVESHNEELITDLSNLDPSMRYIFEEKEGTMHWPNFLFMNHQLGKVFAVGIGRKYRLFGYDVEEYAAGEESSITSSELYQISGTNGEYLEKFKELDYWSLIPNIVENLELFANSMDDWNDLFPDHDEEEPYTDEMNECNENLDLSIAALSVYFPQVDAGDLNSQDY
jgi:hypothetical protein